MQIPTFKLLTTFYVKTSLKAILRHTVLFYILCGVLLSCGIVFAIQFFTLLCIPPSILNSRVSLVT